MRNGSNQVPEVSLWGMPIYGDASHGDLDFNGVDTLIGVAPSANVYTMNLVTNGDDVTIRSGVTVKAKGFDFCADGTLYLEDATARLTFGANNGSGSTGGASGSQVGNLATSFGGGGAGRTGTTGAGSPGSGSGGNNFALSSGGAGGNAGAQLGGAGNTSASPAATVSTPANMIIALIGRTFSAATVILFNGGGGGGGGALDLSAGGSGNGGGGGSSSGTQNVRARRLRNKGMIDSDGGDGAAATAVAPGIAGGGAGGGAGTLNVFSEDVIEEGTLRARGGRGGAGANGGLAGADGTDGKVNRHFGRE